MVFNISEAAEKFKEARRSGKSIAGLDGRWFGYFKIQSPLKRKPKNEQQVAYHASRAAVEAGKGLLSMSSFPNAKEAIGEAHYGAYSAEGGDNLEAYKAHDRSAILHLLAANDQEEKGRSRYARGKAARHRRAALANILAAEKHKRLVTYDDFLPETKERYDRWKETTPEFSRWLDRTKQQKKEHLAHEYKDVIATLMHHSGDNPNLLNRFSQLNENGLREEGERQKKVDLPLLVNVKNEREFHSFAAGKGSLGSITIPHDTESYPRQPGQLVIFRNKKGGIVQLGRVHRVEPEGNSWRVHLDNEHRSEFTPSEKHAYDIGYKRARGGWTTGPLKGQLENQLFRTGRYDAENQHHFGRSLGVPKRGRK